ncbi:MAG TPA: CheR family methyltransferase [Methylomirabilota bacterium]|nr:CheR family methyltransferase [Methylomirabilota bacterium]
MPAIAPDLKPEEFALIRDFIRERTGIFFHENKAYFIQNRLVDRLTQLGCSSFMDYYYLLKYDPSQEEMEQLVDLITTRETSFFRNPPQLAAFQSKLLPELVARKQRSGERTLRLWSAGCASGEEPYTLGVILCASVPFPMLWDLQIVANDISRTALTHARRGIYPRETLKNLDPALLQKHFLPVSNTYHVRDEVKRLVHFSHLNLSDERRMALIRNMDVIFCRNVLIYFGMETRKKVIQQFYDSLNPGGYLFLGHSESLHSLSKAFRILPYDGAFAYQKD